MQESGSMQDVQICAKLFPQLIRQGIDAQSMVESMHWIMFIVPFSCLLYRWHPINPSFLSSFPIGLQ
jgi:hypothetical protein